jgi:DNA-directed RNA polymerase
MKNFTGFEWLLIDAANQRGHDKLTFEQRIEWATDNLAFLESFTNVAETRPLYIKAVMAIRKAQQGIPTGHMVGVDSVCSGIQIMSVLTGCVAGATATGCVDPDVRADAYNAMTEAMGKILGNPVAVSRKDAKDATMTLD